MSPCQPFPNRPTRSPAEVLETLWRPGPRLDDFATSPQNHIWSDGQRLWVAARDGYVYLSPPFEALYESLRWLCHRGGTPTSGLGSATD